MLRILRLTFPRRRARGDVGNRRGRCRLEEGGPELQAVRAVVGPATRRLDDACTPSVLPKPKLYGRAGRPSPANASRRQTYHDEPREALLPSDQARAAREVGRSSTVRISSRSAYWLTAGRVTGTLGTSELHSRALARLQAQALGFSRPLHCALAIAPLMSDNDACTFGI